LSNAVKNFNNVFPVAEHVDKARAVFCNRDLKFENLKSIGFDMDYTLARYRQEALDALSVELTLERLVEHCGYPEEIKEIQTQPAFAIRGLVIDKVLGNIIKLDSHRHVGKGYHGLKELTRSQRFEYRNVSIRLNSEERFALVDTLFALPEAYLYAAIVDFLEVHPEVKVGFVQLYDDIRFAIDMAHRDGSIKKRIMADVGKYIVADPELAITLHKLRSSRKKIFLLTNSYATYTEKVMTFLLDGILADYPSWKHYFDIIITAAHKPGFFTKNEPFLEVNAEEEIVNEDVRSFERGVMYQGGNVVEFERLAKVHGESICYIGDHIYGDIVRSKKTSAWRTVMIVQEMEDELRLAGVLRDELSIVQELERELLRVTSELAFDKSLDGEGNEDRSKERKSCRDRLKRHRKKLVDRLESAESLFESKFNPFWGLIFKLGNENTLFGAQVEDYACLYTSGVSNFLYYSPNHYFRSPRQLMPHERF